ncbi:MAG TPA: carbohydrate ABC transporter permease [Aggregatilineaceae bacterium]|nr:carbohydrate ABC transporter permease [Aggregatilineaceae bacterium]
MLTKRQKRMQMALAVVLCFISIFYAMPYAWMISTSFKPDSELYDQSLLPKHPTLNQYDRLLNGYALKSGKIVKIEYFRYYQNSLIVTITSVLLILTLDALAAFAFAKYNFFGKNILFWIMLMTMMLPIYATLIPSYILFSRFYEWVNSYKALIIPGVVDAYGIFLLTQYMRGIPTELLDAARIDGAGPLRTFWHIVVPLSRPVLATLAIFKFLSAWNDYLWPLVIIREEKMFTLTLGIAQMQVRQGMVVWGIQMAAAVLATIPVLILVFAMQRQFLRGITTGAIKA